MIRMLVQRAGGPCVSLLRDTAMGMIAVICPNLKCKRTLRVPEQVRGQVVRCKHCSSVFSVPEKKKVPVRLEA